MRRAAAAGHAHLEGKNGQDEGIARVVRQSVGALQPQLLQQGPWPARDAGPVQLPLPPVPRASCCLILQANPRS